MDRIIVIYLGLLAITCTIALLTYSRYWSPTSHIKRVLSYILLVARNIKESSFDRWMFVVQTYWTKTVRELNRNAIVLASVDEKRGKGSIEKPNIV